MSKSTSAAPSPLPHQLSFRLSTPTGGTRPLTSFTAPSAAAGTPDDAVASLLAASIRMRSEGRCWCYTRKGHRRDRCKCQCKHRRTRKGARR